MKKSIKVRALLAKQAPDIPLYSFYIKGNDILRIADVSRIKRGEAGELLGYQRKEVRSHVDEIANYLNNDASILTHAIIFGAFNRSHFQAESGA